MSQLKEVSLRGNANVSIETTAKTILAIYGKDFLKKFPLLKDSGALRKLIERLGYGNSCSVIMSSTAVDRLRKANDVLHNKGIAPVVSIAAVKDIKKTPEPSKLLVIMSDNSEYDEDSVAAYQLIIMGDGDRRHDVWYHPGLGGNVLIQEYLGCNTSPDIVGKNFNYIIAENFAFSTLLRYYSVFEKLLEEYGEVDIEDIDFDSAGESVGRGHTMVTLVEVTRINGKPTLVATPADEVL